MKIKVKRHGSTTIIVIPCDSSYHRDKTGSGACPADNSWRARAARYGLKLPQ